MTESEIERFMTMLGLTLVLFMVGAVFVLCAPYGGYGAGLMAALTGVLWWRVYRPTLWQLCHPRKAWWMATKGRKLVAAWEAERETERRASEPRLIIR